MNLRPWIIYILVGFCEARDFYFYADVRWDLYNYYKDVLWENEIPYDHGLRVMTAISMAKDKIQAGLRIWSRSPVVVNGTVKNHFYQSNAEYVAVCKGIDGSDSPSPCLLNSNYDMGFCSPTVLEPIKDPSAVSGLHCKNNPPQGHVFPFKEKEDEHSSSIPLLKEGEKIHIILPDGTGLNKENLDLYLKKFKGVARSKTISLGALNDRVKFLINMFGQDFAGIIGSTENAYYTAIIAKNLGVPNIVPFVSEREGIWPQSSSENFAPGTMDSTLVLGYEDWIINDQLAYIITKAGWGSGAMSILAETGYSERWARNIKNNIGAELYKRNEGYIRAAEDITVRISTTTDLYRLKDYRNRMSFRNKFFNADKSSNFFVVIGKELFLREVLEWFKIYKKYKDTVHVFGVVLIPETGAPCPNFVWSTRAAKTSNWFVQEFSDVAVEKVLEGVFAICHNSHNRGPWKWKKSDNMSTDGSDSLDKLRYKFDPPSLNTETNYDPKIGQTSYDLNRKYHVADEELDLSRWNEFEKEWLGRINIMFETAGSRRSARVTRENFRATSIAAFTHDSLIWGMFTAVLNRTHPELFVSDTGEYTLMNLFGDGSTHRDTNNNPSADMTRIGWPGMFGYESPNMKHYNETHWQTRWSVLINEGPWHDFVNRYTFKDNRPFGAVPWTIKMYSQGKWHRYAGLLPHRREPERDDLPYERNAEALATSAKTDLHNNPITAGVPIYDNYKFIRYFQSVYDYADTSEPACTYDSVNCAIQNFFKSFFPLALILGILFTLPIADKLYFGKQRKKFEKACNRMYWRLDPDAEEITFKAPGQGVRSSMMMSTAGAGTAFGGTTFGGGTTAGGGTTFGGNTTVGGTSAGIETTGFDSMLTGTRAMSSLGISSSSGNSKGGKQQVFTDIAVYKNKRWALKPMEEFANGLIRDPSKEFKIEMKRMYDELIHSNVIQFGGLVYQPQINKSLFFTEYCSKGSLQDVLEDSTAKLDLTFRLSFVVDIINGMDYLHNFTHMRSHGYLKSSNILITGSFTARIADFGTLMRTNDIEKVGHLEYIGRQIRNVWTAPEILRNEGTKELKGTREGDVYSFGIICHEIIECSGPFNSHDDYGLGADEVVQKVISRKHKKPFRPAFSGNRDNEREITVMEMAINCWEENPSDRPTFAHLRMNIVPKIEDGMTLGQCILHQFKQMVEEKEKEIKTFEIDIRSKKEAFSEMQRQLLPQHVLNKLVVGQAPEPIHLPSTSVLNLEITGTTGMLSKCGDNFWTSIEQIRESIIGLSRDHSDLFCVVASATQFIILANGSEVCPESQTTDLLKLCQDVQNFIELLELPGFKLSIRAGIDSGPSYVGLVGAKFRSFQIYGETYHNAFTLRSNASDGTCCVTGNALKMLRDRAKEFENIRPIRSIPNVKVFATQLSSLANLGVSANEGEVSES